MARRRYISTEISVDKKVNKLAMQYGDFAALLYTWMIPHVGDNCEISGDFEELFLIVLPGRKDKTEDDIKNALSGMTDLKLVLPFIRNEKPMLFFPPKSFYKYQTYISRENRNYQGIEQREQEENAEKRRESPKNTVSPSPSLSPSLNIEEDDEDKRARDGEVFQFFNKNIGLITPFQAEAISKCLDEGMQPETIIAILKDSLGKRDKWSWIIKVLNNSINQNVKTLEEYEAKKIERQNAKSRDKPQQKTRAELKEEAYKKAQKEALQKLESEGFKFDDEK